jgi:hypothetical protein
MPVAEAELIHTRRELHHLTDQARRLLAALELGDRNAIRIAATRLAETIETVEVAV